MKRRGRPPKVNRNRALIEYRDRHPKVSFLKIGGFFRMSKQAAWSIYKRGRRQSN